MGQAEGIAFRNGTYGYISNEKLAKTIGSVTIRVTQKLRSFDIGNFIAQYTLPLSLNGLKAYYKNQGVMVEWNTALQADVAGYEVQKSANGKAFLKQITLQPVSSSSASKTYTWFDVDAYEGYNFYRVKIIKNSGETSYSAIAKVRVSKTMPQVNIYPNPAPAGNIVFLLANMHVARFSASLYNAEGQKIYTANFQNTGLIQYQIKPPFSVVKGIYQLQIKGNNIKMAAKLAIQ